MGNVQRTILRGPGIQLYSQLLDEYDVLQPGLTDEPIQAPPVRLGWSFGGWWTAETGGQRITNMLSVGTLETRTFYARWVVDELALEQRQIVTFNPAGGL